MNETSWVLTAAREEAKIISDSLGVQPEIAQVLVNRNVCTVEDARKFLFGTMDDLYHPELMKGMKEAVERIRRAVSRQEKILIFGDYDVDGVLSVVVLTKALRSLGADVDYFIPERLKDGYGLKEEHISVVLKRGARLVISVDCGTKATRFARRAKESGVDLIITDHHLPGDHLPEALAILNPILSESGYPDRSLAGIGVVFKLIQALFEGKTGSASLPHYLKLVAIGTIADVSELRGENRVFVKLGLEGLQDVSNKGLMSLMGLCGLAGKRVSAGDVGFRIGPRINAAGRMGAADLAVQLFFADSSQESLQLARHLDELNSTRQKTQDRIYEQALKKIRDRGLDRRYKFLVLGCEEWHRGVIGIVASKIKDFFHRPALLFSYEDTQAYGSGRSISEFSMINCLDEAKGLLLEYGGHTMAVGCTLARENVPRFKDEVNKFAESRLTEEHLRRRLFIDSRINFTEISPSFLRNYYLLSPFGVGNPKPVFMTEDVEVIDRPQKIKDKHCKLLVRQKERIFEALGWERGDWAQSLDKGDTIDIVYSFQFSEYMGQETLSLSVEDIRKRI